MAISDPKPGEQVKDVRFDTNTMSVDLADGRTITVPLVWYPRLFHASPTQRSNWQISGGGYGRCRLLQFRGFVVRSMSGWPTNAPAVRRTMS